MRVLLDVNMLLALSFRGHSQHFQARAWLETVQKDDVVVRRIAQSGLLRLLTTREVMGADVQTMSQAWRAYDQLMLDPRFLFGHEPDGIQKVWRVLCPPNHVAPKKWVDAYLAAFAIAAGLRLATFDRGFRDFPRLDLILLGPAAVHEAEPVYEID